MKNSCRRQKACSLGEEGASSISGPGVTFPVLFLAMGNLPIIDYSRRESFACVKEPTQGNLDALHARQNEELGARWLYASPLGALAVVFAFPFISLIGARNQRGQVEARHHERQN